jgi:hypothetical protein
VILPDTLPLHRRIGKFNLISAPLYLIDTNILRVDSTSQIRQVDVQPQQQHRLPSIATQLPLDSLPRRTCPSIVLLVSAARHELRLVSSRA